MMSAGDSIQFIDLGSDEDVDAIFNKDPSRDDLSDSDLARSGVLCGPEVNIKDLTIKLLTSPENLDFALQHQADKVLDLQGKVSQLLSLNTMCPSATPHQSQEHVQHFLSDSPADLTDRRTDQEVTQRQEDQTDTISTYPSRGRKPRSSTCRAKNRPRPKYIQLPPSFKYPEPIDIRPTRGYAPTSDMRRDVNTQHNYQLLQASPATSVPNLTTNVNGSLHQVPMGIVQDTAVVNNSQDCQEQLKSLQFMRGENRNKPTSQYQYATKGIFQSESNNDTTEHNVSQKLCHNLPQSNDEALPMTVTSAAKSMFEIVVGDVKELDSNVPDRVFWEGRSMDLGQFKETSSMRPPHKRVCPKHSGHGNRFQCVCPGSRITKPWGQIKSSPMGTRFPTPFMHWKNAIELSRARRCRTKIEPDMLDLLEMKYNESHFVSPYERKTLAEKLGITERAVIYWFQNRRRKDIKNLNNMNMGQPPPNV